MMPLHINSANPCEDLKRNPYAFNEIFSKHKDFTIDLIKEITEHNILIFEKKFNGTAEIAFVMCIDEKVNEAVFKRFMELYKKFVLSLPNRNFKEAEPIIIAKSFEDDVIKLLDVYNSNYEKRKPFRIFTYKS